MAGARLKASERDFLAVLDRVIYANPSATSGRS